MTDIANQLKHSSSKGLSPFFQQFSALHFPCLVWIPTGTSSISILATSTFLIHKIFTFLCNKELKQVQWLMHDFVTFKIVQL